MRGELASKPGGSWAVAVRVGGVASERSFDSRPGTRSTEHAIFGVRAVRPPPDNKLSKLQVHHVELNPVG